MKSGPDKEDEGSVDEAEIRLDRTGSTTSNERNDVVWEYDGAMTLVKAQELQRFFGEPGKDTRLVVMGGDVDPDEVFGRGIEKGEIVTRGIGENRIINVDEQRVWGGEELVRRER